MTEQNQQQKKKYVEIDGIINLIDTDSEPEEDEEPREEHEGAAAVESDESDADDDVPYYIFLRNGFKCAINPDALQIRPNGRDNDANASRPGQESETANLNPNRDHEAEEGDGNAENGEAPPTPPRRPPYRQDPRLARRAERERERERDNPQ